VTGKESKTPRQQSIIPANRRRTNRCVLGCFARRRPFSPSLASRWPAGSESRSRATYHNHYKTSVPIYVKTGLVGLSAHKILLDMSRRRATCSPVPSRGICWSATNAPCSRGAGTRWPRGPGKRDDRSKPLVRTPVSGRSKALRTPTSHQEAESPECPSACSCMSV
jgi:hypothetical protein